MQNCITFFRDFAEIFRFSKMLIKSQNFLRKFVKFVEILKMENQIQSGTFPKKSAKLRKCIWIFEIRAAQNYENRVDLEKNFNAEK